MEIEIRAKINDPQLLEKQIIELGGKLIKQTAQKDEYFGEIGLFKKIGYSFLMRVRQEKNNTFLTYKGAATKKDGVWEEYEFKIDNADKALAMLLAMGLEKIITLDKQRKEYVLGEFSICLDEIKNLGSFIEIESQNNAQQDKSGLTELIKKFKIQEEQIIHKGYVTMLLAKNNSPYQEYIVN